MCDRSAWSTWWKIEHRIRGSTKPLSHHAPDLVAFKVQGYGQAERVENVDNNNNDDDDGDGDDELQRDVDNVGSGVSGDGEGEARNKIDVGTARIADLSMSTS